MSDVPETSINFQVPVFGTGFCSTT